MTEINNFDMQNFIIAILFLSATILYYILHKSWIRVTKKNPSAIKQFTKIDTLKGYFLIVVGIIITFVYFIKSFN